MVDATVLIGLAMVLSFAVNIIVQMTKGFIPIPTKLWCIIVAIAIDIVALLGASAQNKIDINVLTVSFAVIGAFVVAYISMYGFDTFKELWARFKKGENINEDSKNKKL